MPHAMVVVVIFGILAAIFVPAVQAVIEREEMDAEPVTPPTLDPKAEEHFQLWADGLGLHDVSRACAYGWKCTVRFRFEPEGPWQLTSVKCQSRGCYLIMGDW